MSAIWRCPLIEVLLCVRYEVSANRGLVICPLSGSVR